ncbi:hypothetical protein BC829DRAFT_491006 [Chytridium lagenaria]|nr:hypothetical protein BC829DRAFT_491006 [Chytridium lagenaria]
MTMDEQNGNHTEETTEPQTEWEKYWGLVSAPILIVQNDDFTSWEALIRVADRHGGISKESSADDISNLRQFMTFPCEIPALFWVLEEIYERGVASITTALTFGLICGFQDYSSVETRRISEHVHANQEAVHKRWVFEAEIKRPYFHIKPLDDAQVANWRKYLDFEENEGDYADFEEENGKVADAREVYARLLQASINAISHSKNAWESVKTATCFVADEKRELGYRFSTFSSTVTTPLSLLKNLSVTSLRNTLSKCPPVRLSSRTNPTVDPLLPFSRQLLRWIMCRATYGDDGWGAYDAYGRSTNGGRDAWVWSLPAGSAAAAAAMWGQMGGYYGQQQGWDYSQQQQGGGVIRG